ncbi:toxin-antitoxin system HicB family antitoxin [Cellulosimicrobium cellulans]|uniref:toxin-antitoxin system HicB family antitoxin n=1 Tax=Cellulosimicrobium cellulans TaxID=1710 RepID=UPI000849650A|nr:toxin-antitoxin system HicB family antitoxin [Cellulosimicrobium cellulans]
MDLNRYVDDLQHRLTTAADAAGEEARELAGRLTAPLDAAVRLVLLDALSAAAGEISAELAPGSVDVRLRGGDPEFVVAAPPAPAQDAGAAPTTAPAPSPAAPPAPPVADVDAAATTRTTLRLPDHLKAQVEVAAARDGVSVNTWLVRAVAAALEQTSGRPAAQPRPDQRGTTRLTGWVR